MTGNRRSGSGIVSIFDEDLLPLGEGSGGDDDEVTMSELGGVNGLWFSAWLACQCPYPTVGGTQEQGGLMTGWKDYTTEVPKELNGTEKFWNACLAGDTLAVGGVDNITSNPASCMVYDHTKARSGDKKCPAGQPIEYNIYIWDNKEAKKVNNTMGFIFVPVVKEQKYGTKSHMVDYSKMYRDAESRALMIKNIYNVLKGAIGIASVSATVMSGGGGGILEMAGWALPSMISVFDNAKGRTTEEAQKQHAANKKALKAENEASQSENWDGGWLSGVWSWFGFSAAAGGEAVAHVINQEIEGEEGKALRTAEAELAKKQRQRHLKAERQLSKLGTGGVRQMLNGAIGAIVDSGPSIQQIENKEEEAGLDQDYKDRRAKLLHDSHQYQKYWMYMIKMRVGIIYQMRINSAILKTLARSFLKERKGRSEGEKWGINPYQIARINQLINFGQTCMGGPGVAWEVPEKWDVGIQKFVKEADGERIAPYINKNIWEEMEARDTGVNPFTSANAPLETTVFKSYLPGVFNYGTKDAPQLELISGNENGGLWSLPAAAVGAVGAAGEVGAEAEELPNERPLAPTGPLTALGTLDPDNGITNTPLMGLIQSMQKIVGLRIKTRSSGAGFPIKNIYHACLWQKVANLLENKGGSNNLGQLGKIYNPPGAVTAALPSCWNKFWEKEGAGGGGGKIGNEEAEAAQIQACTTDLLKDSELANTQQLLLRWFVINRLYKYRKKLADKVDVELAAEDAEDRATRARKRELAPAKIGEVRKPTLRAKLKVESQILDQMEAASANIKELRKREKILFVGPDDDEGAARPPTLKEIITDFNEAKKKISGDQPADHSEEVQLLKSKIHTSLEKEEDLILKMGLQRIYTALINSKAEEDHPDALLEIIVQAKIDSLHEFIQMIKNKNYKWTTASTTGGANTVRKIEGSSLVVWNNWVEAVKNRAAAAAEAEGVRAAAARAAAEEVASSGRRPAAPAAARTGGAKKAAADESDQGAKAKSTPPARAIRKDGHSFAIEAMVAAHKHKLATIASNAPLNSFFNDKITEQVMNLPMLDAGESADKIYNEKAEALRDRILREARLQERQATILAKSIRDVLVKCCRGLRSEKADDVAGTEDDSLSDKTALQRAVNWDLRTVDIHEYQHEAAHILKKLSKWVDIDFDNILLLYGWQALGSWYSSAPPICWRRATDIERDMVTAAEKSQGAHVETSAKQDFWVRFEGFASGELAKLSNDCDGAMRAETGKADISQNKYWWWGSARNVPCDAGWTNMTTTTGLIRGVDNKILPMGGLFFKCTDASENWEAIKQWTTRTDLASVGAQQNVAFDDLPYVDTLVAANIPRNNLIESKYIYKQTWEVSYRKEDFWYLSYFLSNRFLDYVVQNPGFIRVNDVNSCTTTGGQIDSRGGGPEQIL